MSDTLVDAVNLLLERLDRFVAVLERIVDAQEQTSRSLHELPSAFDPPHVELNVPLEFRPEFAFQDE